MHAEFRLFTGLLIVHALWAIAYVTGTLLDARDRAPATRARALLDLVVRSTSGIALWGFGTFLLALAGRFDAFSLGVLALAFALAARLRHGAAFFTGAFWRERAHRVGLAFGATNLLLFYVALALAVSAALPTVDSDPVRYQLAYPMDWVNHHGLFLDRFLRQPLYANNYLLVFAAMDALHLEAWTQFASWLCGALALLAVRAALCVFDEAAPPARTRFAALARGAVTALVPLAIVIPAVFLRWLDTGMVDVPMELYAFVPALCALAALLGERDLRWSAVCCGGFAIGMKITLIAFAPLFAITVWLLVRRAGGDRRAAALACAVMLLLGSPWYVRNVVYDHDPVPPVVNLALHRPDLTYTPEDAAGVLQDLRPDRSLEALAALPYRMFADPLHPTLREFGSVSLNLFLYVPFLAAAAGLALGARTPRTRALMLVCATSAYAVVYCLLTSYLMRYLLITQVPLAVAIGALLLSLPSARLVPAAQLAGALACIVPSPAAFPRYDFLWQSNYLAYETRFRSDAAYLRANLSGYDEVRDLLANPVLHEQPPPRVLLVGVDAEYYFRLAGVQTIGDWIGPGRYDDLRTAIENDRLADYLAHFQIGAVLFRRNGPPIFSRAEQESLAGELRRLGFRILENDPGGFLVAVRSEPPGHERGEARRDQDVRQPAGVGAETGADRHERLAGANDHVDRPGPAAERLRQP
jgi:hypothetical protein